MPETTMNQAKATDDGDELWMVVAIIQPFRLDAVTLALEGIPGFGGMTVTPCRGFGRGKAQTPDRGSAPGPRRHTDTGLTDFTDKVKLEIAVAGRAQSRRVIDVIAQAAHTGNRGDGKVFVWPFARALRIRTFETDAAAIRGPGE